MRVLCAAAVVRVSVYVKNPVERELRVRVRAVTASSAAPLESGIPLQGGKRAEEEEKKEEGDSTPVVPAPPSVSVWSSCLPAAASCAVSMLDEWVQLPAYDDLSEDSAAWPDTSRQSGAVKDNPQVRQPPLTHSLTISPSAAAGSHARAPLSRVLQLVASRALSKVGLYMSVTPLRAQTPLQVQPTDQDVRILLSALTTRPLTHVRSARSTPAVQFGLMVDVESDEAPASSSGYAALHLDAMLELGTAPG